MKSSSLRSRSVALHVESLEERRVLSTASYVSALYPTLLHRPADAAGVATWSNLIDQGALSPLQVATAFTSSAEFRSNLVVTDYQQLLGRTPQAGEIAGWLNALGNGLPETELASVFQGSAEYFQNHGDTNAGWLTGVYQDELGRAPDAGGEAAWLTALQNGLPRQAAAATIAVSTEALMRVVTAGYQSVLGRDADALGLAAWTAGLARGLPPSQLLAALASSPEFISAKGGLNGSQPGGTPATGNDFEPGTDGAPVVILPSDTGTTTTVTPVDTTTGDTCTVDSSTSDNCSTGYDCTTDTTDPSVDPGTDNTDTSNTVTPDNSSPAPADNTTPDTSSVDPSSPDLTA
jgi:hypothetical protein